MSSLPLHPLTARLTHLAALTSTVYLAGAISNVSVLTLPVLLSSAPSTAPHTTTPTQSLAQKAIANTTSHHLTPTPLLLKVWRQIYMHGHIQGPLLSAFAASLWGYTAYQHHQTHLYSPYVTALSTAAALTASIMPYTWVVMSSTNSRLFELAARADGEGLSGKEEAEARGCVERWGRLNFWRGMVPLVGGVVGGWVLVW